MKQLILLAILAISAFGQDAAPVAPVITWDKPMDIRNPAPLTIMQLNATASVPGTFVYTPALGTVLAVGVDRLLTATFTATDTTLPAAEPFIVKLTVIGEYFPYDPSENAYVCHVNPDLTAVIDVSTGMPRCFVVPVPVNQSITKFMISQSAGLNADGSVAYKYSSWWDLVVKHFITTLVNPMLDQFPPSDLVAAKAAAAAALAAVDAAKEAILMGRQ